MLAIQQYMDLCGFTHLFELMPTCEECDAYVTRDFVRVFGIDGNVHGCPHCSTYRELQDGEGAGRDTGVTADGG